MAHIITDAQYARTDNDVPFTRPTTHRAERHVTPNWLRALYALLITLVVITGLGMLPVILK